MDDHILHIIIRGYGQADQAADVFTTLAVYAGLPAFWTRVRMSPSDRGAVLSFVRVDGRWAMCDVAHGVVFADAAGRFLPVEELAREPGAIEVAAAGRSPNGFSYRQYLERAQPVEAPSVLRAQLQMPWPRLAYEIKRTLHLIDAEEAQADSGPTERIP